MERDQGSKSLIIRNEASDSLVIQFEPYGILFEVPNSSEFLACGEGDEKESHWEICLYSDVINIWEHAVSRVLFSVDGKTVLDLRDEVQDEIGGSMTSLEAPLENIIDSVWRDLKTNRPSIEVENTSSHRLYRKYLLLDTHMDVNVSILDLLIRDHGGLRVLSKEARFAIEGVSGNEQSSFKLVRTSKRLEIGHSDFQQTIVYVMDEVGEVSGTLVMDEK